MIGKSLFQLMSGFLTLVIFLTNAVFLHAQESNLWAERKKHADQRRGNAWRVAALPPSSANLLRQIPSPDRVTRGSALSGAVVASLPSSFTRKHAELLDALSLNHGIVRGVTLASPGGGERIVIHVQDVHKNMEAQRNIGALVDGLFGRIQLVALEGAFSPLGLAPYRRFPDREAFRVAVDDMLAQNEISGPIHAAVTSAAQNLPSFEGVDDVGLHRANVEAYRRSVASVVFVRKELSIARERNRADKMKAFSQDLAAFDARVDDYREGRSSLGAHLRVLSEIARLSPAGALFLRVLEKEESLDFKAVERERALLVEALVSRASPGDLRRLADHSLAYRTGGMGYGDFYRFLLDFCHRAGAELSHYPAFHSYVDYVLLSDRVDAEALFREMGRLERAAYDHLARSEDEKRLVSESKRLYLIEKLLDFTLTPEEWREYEAAKVAAPAARIERDLSPFEDFYHEAEARNRAMADNLEAAMDRRGAHAAVLVMGGFHSGAVEALLAEKGISSVRVTPRITRADVQKGGDYLAVFTREKTPLEKIFEGEKLFLADAPLNKMAPLGVGGRYIALKGGDQEGVEAAFQPLSDRIKKIIHTLHGRGSETRITFKSGSALIVTIPDLSAPTFDFQEISPFPWQKVWTLAERLNLKKLLIEQGFTLPALTTVTLAHVFFSPAIDGSALAALELTLAAAGLAVAWKPFKGMHPQFLAAEWKISPLVYQRVVLSGFLTFGLGTLIALIQALGRGIPLPIAICGSLILGVGSHAFFNIVSPAPAMGATRAGSGPRFLRVVRQIFKAAAWRGGLRRLLPSDRLFPPNSLAFYFFRWSPFGWRAGLGMGGIFVEWGLLVSLGQAMPGVGGSVVVSIILAWYVAVIYAMKESHWMTRLREIEMPRVTDSIVQLIFLAPYALIPLSLDWIIPALAVNLVYGAAMIFGLGLLRRFRTRRLREILDIPLDLENDHDFYQFLDVHSGALDSLGRDWVRFRWENFEKLFRFAESSPQILFEDLNGRRDSITINKSYGRELLERFLREVQEAGKRVGWEKMRRFFENSLFVLEKDRSPHLTAALLEGFSAVSHVLTTENFNEVSRVIHQPKQGVKAWKASKSLHHMRAAMTPDNIPEVVWLVTGRNDPSLLPLLERVFVPGNYRDVFRVLEGLERRMTPKALAGVLRTFSPLLTPENFMERFSQAEQVAEAAGESLGDFMPRLLLSREWDEEAWIITVGFTQKLKSLVASPKKRAFLMGLIFSPAVRDADLPQLLESVETILRREPLLGISIVEGLIEGVSSGALPRRLSEKNLKDILAHVSLFRSFHPNLFKIYLSQGEAGLLWMRQYQGRILKDDVGPTDLADMDGGLHRSGLSALDVVESVIPPSGASFVSRAEVPRLWDQRQRAGDLRAHVPIPLRGRVWGREEPSLGSAEYVLKAGRVSDSNDVMGGLVRALSPPMYGTSEGLKKEAREALSKSLREYLQGGRAPRLGEALADAFFSYARHIPRVFSQMTRLSPDPYKRLRFMEGLFNDEDGLPALLVPVVRELLQWEPELAPLAPSYGKQRVIKPAVVAKELPVILAKAGRLALAHRLVKFHPGEVENKILPLVSDPVVRSAVQEVLGRAPVSVPGIVSELFSGFRVFFATELDNYEIMPQEREIKLIFRAVKGVPYGLWGITAGVCVVDYPGLWEDPNFFLISMVDESSGRVVGFIQLYQVMINGRKVLSVPGIQPEIGFLSEMDAGEVFHRIERTLLQVAEEGGYDAVYLPADPNVLSNRAEINQMVESRYAGTKSRLDRPIKWNHNKNHDFREVYVLWERRGGRGSEGDLDEGSASGRRPFAPGRLRAVGTPMALVMIAAEAQQVGIASAFWGAAGALAVFSLPFLAATLAGLGRSSFLDSFRGVKGIFFSRAAHRSPLVIDSAAALDVFLAGETIDSSLARRLAPVESLRLGEMNRDGIIRARLARELPGFLEDAGHRRVFFKALRARPGVAAVFSALTGTAAGGTQVMVQLVGKDSVREAGALAALVDRTADPGLRLVLAAEDPGILRGVAESDFTHVAGREKPGWLEGDLRVRLRRGEDVDSIAARRIVEQLPFPGNLLGELMALLASLPAAPVDFRSLIETARAVAQYA